MWRLLAAAAAACLLTTCSKASSTAPTPFANAIGIVAMASPVAKTASAAYFATAGNSALSAAESALKKALAQTDPTVCLQGAFTFATPNVPGSTCYGPSLDYQHHPDGADGSACISGYACYQPEQIGIWSATEASGEACASAKANGIHDVAAHVTNSSLLAVAGLICAAHAIGFHEPAVGASLDLTALANKYVSGANFSAATISQLSPRTGAYSTWQTKMVGTVSGQRIELSLLHSASTADNSTFSGHFFGLVGDGASNFTFSFSYQQTSGNLKFVTRFGIPTAVTSDPFDVNNDVDFNNSLLQGQLISYTLASVDPGTGLGSAGITWMDDSTDAYARTFQLTSASGLSADAGLAYFGFSAPLSTSTGRGQISKMICNWGGPGADNSGLAGRAEAQHFARNSDGLFLADQSAIVFAPTNSCSYTPGTFAVDVSPNAPVALGAISPNFVHFNGTTGVGDWGNLGVLAEPTY